MALLAASLGISITSVVLGATNLNSNCTGISQIPAYLITTGVLGLVACCTFSSVFCKACANHCCGDGEGKLTYDCRCCGMLLCADDVTRANCNNAKSTAATIKSAGKSTTKTNDLNKSYEEMRRACDVLEKTDVIINMEPPQKTTNITDSSDA